MLKIKLFSTGEVVTVTPNEAHGLIDSGRGELLRVYEDRKRRERRKSRKKLPKSPRKYNTREMRPSSGKGYKIK